MNMRYILLFTLLSYLTIASAQKTSFSTASSVKNVAVGVPFEVSFSLENGKIKGFTPPSFEDFEILEGPISQPSIFSFNGVTIQNHTYIYSIAAKKPGNLQIGRATIETEKGQKLSSQPINITVKEGDGSGGALDGQVFFKLEASNENVVIGEQVVIDLKIYSQIAIEQINILKYPNVPDIYSKPIPNINQEVLTEQVNGKPYRSKLLHRLVLFPDKSGTIKIDPSVVQIGVTQVEDGGIWGQFKRMVGHTISSNKLEIKVASLDGAPSGYSGTVGNYEMKAYVENNTLKADEAIQLYVRIQGEGDLKQVLKPNLDLPKDVFDTYPPNIKEDIKQVNGVFGGTKMMEYIITPTEKASGNYELRPNFTFFNPALRRFVTLDTIIPIQIVGNNLASTNTNTEENTTEQVTGEYTTTQSNTQLAKPSTPFFGSLGFWLATLGFFAAWGGIYVWKRSSDKPVSEAFLQQLRAKQAHSEAKKRLQTASKYQKQQDVPAFHKEVMNVVYSFIADKFNISPNNLTTPEIVDLLKANGAEQDLTQQIKSVLMDCEMALFARFAPKSMDSTYQSTVQIIEYTNKLLSETA